VDKVKAEIISYAVFNSIKRIVILLSG